MPAYDTAKQVVLIPKLEVDNSEVEAQLPEPASEGEMLKRCPHLQNLFQDLRKHLETDGVASYTTSKSFRSPVQAPFKIWYSDCIGQARRGIVATSNSICTVKKLDA